MDVPQLMVLNLQGQRHSVVGEATRVTRVKNCPRESLDGDMAENLESCKLTIEQD